MTLQDFFIQFNALCWKNFILKRRYMLSLLIELALPILILFVLGVMKSFLNPVTIPESIPGNENQRTYGVGSFYSEGRAPWICGHGSTGGSDPGLGGAFSNALWDCTNSLQCVYESGGNNYADLAASGCRRNYLAVAPRSADNLGAATAAKEFVNWAETSGGGGMFKANLPNATWHLFKSEADVVNHITDPLYVIRHDAQLIYGAVVFISGAPNWEYVLRFNRTNVPETTLPDIDVSVKTNEGKTSGDNSLPYLQQYVFGGSFIVSNAVNSFIASMTCKSSGLCGNNADNVTLLLDMVADFPSPAVTTSEFWANFLGFFPILMIIVLLYPVSNMIKALVSEKESKQREGMLMMAMRQDALWASWIFNFICLLLPLSIALTFVGKGGIFTYSSSEMIFIFFFMFFLSAMSYSIFVSTFFAKARTASILGALIFFSGWFISLGLKNINPTRSQLIAAALHPAAAFTIACNAFAEYESAQIGVTLLTWDTSTTNPVTFRDMMNMMFVDCIYLLALTWYFEQVWPSEFGTQKPWYFIFQPKYWMKTFRLRSNNSVYRRVHLDDGAPAIEMTHVEAKSMVENLNGGSETVYNEPVAVNLRAQIENRTCVDIRKLYKQFDTTSGVKVAVNDLSLTLYSGQITALLGHNGAGKTTTIGMLTGLIPADSGTAIIEGYDLNNEMSEIRRNLGVCPQHDVLFPELTVEEHLLIFGMFKGITGTALTDTVNKMILAVGLTEKRHVASANLSGGQKRKLSVAIAFVGGSRVIFLDEPTSGMDPYSRRFTWNVIRQNKEGRVIVLTTHFMDEADLLGDRIAIMGGGKLLCCGSSIFLKNAYGVGYNITLEKTTAVNFDTSLVTDLLKKHVSDYKLLSNAGNELTFQLPFSSSSSFGRLFTEIDGNLEYLHLRSYGISVTTLEEVFLRVAQLGEAKKGELLTSEKNVNDVNLKDVENGGCMYSPVQFEKLDENDDVQFFICHMRALLNKRIFYFLRDKKTWVFQYVVPGLFVLLGLIIMWVTTVNENQPFKALRTTDYNFGISTEFLPFPYANATSYLHPSSYPPWSFTSIFGQDKIMSMVTDALDCPVVPVDSGVTLHNMSMYLHENRNTYQASTYGAVSFFTLMGNSNVSQALGCAITDQQQLNARYMIHANYTAVHSSHIFNTLVAEAVVRSIDSSSSISIGVHTLPNTYIEKNIYAGFNLGIAVNFIMLAAPSIPAAFATFVVRERETRSKQQQMVSGVSIPAYWLATFIWDMLSYQPIVWFWVILFVIFPKAEVLGTGDGFKSMIAVFILFGSAVSGFSYLLSFLFSSSASAQIVILSLIFILGLLFNVLGIILRLLYRDLFMNGLRYLFLLFPSYALGEGLFNIVYIPLFSVLELSGDAKYRIFDDEISGLAIKFLAVETVVYLLLTIFVDYSLNTPIVRNLLCEFYAKSTLNQYEASKTGQIEDEDVVQEEDRLKLLGGDASNESVVLLKNLQKVYPGGKYAVRGVSLGIPNGECFGLLGINGAGKSSTLAMLTGEFPPTKGEAYIAGMDISSNVHSCRRKIGFCPQFDALFELLTGREHLKLYARIKGIAEKDIDRVVEGKLKELSLVEYADRAAGTYSGGNKRKLSVAIAMIGEPSIVFLDEPSTGMDPVARRFMWEVITDIVTKREKCSVILTTHLMEECEALCTRIGIMVGGKLKCLGSSQRLRTRYGRGFQIEVNFQIPDDDALDELTKRLVASCGNKLQENDQKEPSSANSFHDVDMTPQQVSTAFASMNREYWSTRLVPGGSGGDIGNMLLGTGRVSARLLASWIHFELAFDETCASFRAQFGDITIRERQVSKVRYELSSCDPDGAPRKLSFLFDFMEKGKADLRIQEYSIAQTSLEQIFNQFASQQNEETGRPTVVVV